MKNFTIIHILLFILLLLAYQCSNAQDYMIHVKGDTVWGQIKPLTFGSEKKLQVVSADKTKSIYSIFQVRAYSYKGETFWPVKSDRGYVFMKLLKPGYLSLFAFQLENQTAFDGLYLRKKDGEGLEVPNLSFKKYMTRFLEDCEEVSAQIASGDLGKKDLHQIIDAYNLCVANRTNNQTTKIIKHAEQMGKINSWDLLEQKVKEKPDFDGKSDALEMITDIKGKIKRDEKVPNFLIEGLKSSLANAALTQELENALAELKQ